MSWDVEFKEQSIIRIKENPPRIKKCLDRLSEKEVWQKANESSNSVAVLILHLCGNIRQYAISSLGDQPDGRNRSEEFSTEGGKTKAELLAKLESTVEEACDIIHQQSEEQLLRVRSVQGFELSGMGIIIHVTEHLSYHTGQIAYWTKILKDDDLGFYAGVDLDVK